MDNCVWRTNCSGLVLAMHELAAWQQMAEGIVGLAVDFLERALPEPRLLLILTPASLVYGGLSGAFAGWLRTKKNVRTPYTRKVFHFLIFTMAGVIQLAAGLPGVIVFGSVISLCVFYATFRGKGFPFYEAMARPKDEPHRTFFIIVPLLTTALGGVLSNLFFARYAQIGYLVGGWGDAAGEPVGARWGKHRFKVPSLLGVPATRSLEGSLAVFGTGFLAALVGFLAGGVPLTQTLYAAAACALAGALVELISAHGLDNLTVQLVASGTAYFLLAG